MLMCVANNTGIVLYHYLRTLSVKVSRGTVHRLLDTPLGNSMRGISDAMDKLYVKNDVYQLSAHNYFSQLEAPFITTLAVDRNSFCVVTKKDASIVEFFNGERRKNMLNVDKFLQQWTGVVMYGSPTEDTPTEHLYAIKNIISFLLYYKFVIALFLILILGLLTASYQFQTTAFIVYLVLLSLGIIVSVAILYKEQINDQFMERFCHIGKAIDCNEVLHSNGASVVGLGLGELSLLYFAVLYFFSFIRVSDFYGISVICCIAAMAFTFYSVIYQFFVLHKGCMLCMLVNLIVWGNAITLYILGSVFDLRFPLSSFFAFVATGCIGLIFKMQLKSFQDREKERITLKSCFATLLNPEIFQTLLALKPHVDEMISQDIALHNHCTGKDELMVATNPNCKNCMEIHQYIKEMAIRVSVSLVLVTYPDDKVGEVIAKTVIAAYREAGWHKSMELLDEWYETRCIKDINEYTITPDVQNMWAQQQLYCRKQGISRTPSVIVNRHYVPEVYLLSELRYVLT